MLVLPEGADIVWKSNTALRSWMYLEENDLRTITDDQFSKFKDKQYRSYYFTS